MTWTPRHTIGSQLGIQSPPMSAAATVLFEPDIELVDALLAALNSGGWPLIVFLNGAIDSGVEDRLAHMPNIAILRSEKNVGLGAALNAVMEHALSAGHHYVLLLDQDSSPDCDLPDRLYDRFVAEHSTARPVAAVGPTLITPPSGTFRKIRYSWCNRAKGVVYFLPTSGSLISVSAWRTIGPFRTEYFIGGIDVEWGLRAHSKGFASIVAPDITMVHRWGLPALKPGSQAPQILRQSDLRLYYYIRNSVDYLKLPLAPWSWKARYAGNLAGQLMIMLCAKRFAKNSRQMILRALRDGWNGNLGPA